MKILITGGVLRPNGFELGEGKYYGCAKLLRLDTVSGAIEELLRFDDGGENYPDEYPNLEFTVGDVEENGLWLPTDTEIRLYDYPRLRLCKVFSHPCFHNVHSVVAHGDELYVTSTGLDLVVILDKGDGSIKELINVEGKPVWHRFSPDVDYRKVHSTRPHDCHPNFVFFLGEDEPWVTRCTQEDAVSIRDMRRRIDVSGIRRSVSVHDGHIYQDKIYFTHVNGALAIYDKNTLALADLLDLTKLHGFGGMRGWCRGLLFDGGICYVAFSRLRKTRRLEKIAWVKKQLGVSEALDQASILAIDLAERRILADYRIPAGMIDAIYSLLPEPAMTDVRPA